MQLMSSWFLSAWRSSPVRPYINGLSESLAKLILAQSSAIFVTILAPFFLSEKIGLYRWAAVLIGLLGVYLMTNPISIINGTNQLSSLGLSLATFSAISHAGLALTMRKLGKTEHPTTTAFIHNIITSTIVIILIIIFGTEFIGIKGNHVQIQTITEGFTLPLNCQR